VIDRKKYRDIGIPGFQSINAIAQVAATTAAAASTAQQLLNFSKNGGMQ
jgi:hypothetical protein